MLLNENIRHHRLSLGISQVEFAKKIGVTKQCVSNWENDNVQPSIEMLVKICNFFAVSTDSMLGLNENATLSLSGLSSEESAHIRAVVSDLQKHHQNN